MNKKGVLFFLVLIVIGGTIYLNMGAKKDVAGTEDDHDVSLDVSLKVKPKSKNGPIDIKGTGISSGLGSGKKYENPYDELDDETLPEGYFQAPTVSLVLPKGEIGFNEKEGAGSGPAGVQINEKGESIVLDSYRDRIVKVGDDGKVTVLAKVPSDQPIAGFTEGPNGELAILTGNDYVTLTVIDPNGTEKKVAIDKRREFLDPMEMEYSEDGKTIIASGPEGNLEMRADAKESSITMSYGKQRKDGDNEQTFDAYLKDSGNPAWDVRDGEGKPIDNGESKDVHLSALNGTYVQNNGNIIIIGETDPFSGKKNEKNPSYIVVVNDRNNGSVKRFRIPFHNGKHGDIQKSISANAEGQIIRSYINKSGQMVVEKFDTEKAKDQSSDIARVAKLEKQRKVENEVKERNEEAKKPKNTQE